MKGGNKPWFYFSTYISFYISFFGVCVFWKRLNFKAFFPLIHMILHALETDIHALSL